jgi:hypothetical protein
MQGMIFLFGRRWVQNASLGVILWTETDDFLSTKPNYLSVDSQLTPTSLRIKQRVSVIHFIRHTQHLCAIRLVYFTAPVDIPEIVLAFLILMLHSFKHGRVFSIPVSHSGGTGSGSSWFSSVSPGKYEDSTLNYAMTASFRVISI